MRPRNTGHTHDQHTLRHGAGFIQTMGPGTNYWFTPEDKPNWKIFMLANLFSQCHPFSTKGEAIGCYFIR